MSRMINGLEFGDIAKCLEDAYMGRPIKLDENQLNTIMTALRKMYDEPVEPKVEIVYTNEWGEKDHYSIPPTSVEHRQYGDYVEYNINKRISTINRRFKEDLQ